VNVLKANLRITVETLLSRGESQREIERRTGVDRKTIRRYAANSPGVAAGSAGGTEHTPPPRPPAPRAAVSACEAHREFIEAQVALGRNAVSIYQDLVEAHGFEHAYNSVKRYVRGLKAREPGRYDVLEHGPGEEAQVDYGQGAPTRTAGGKYRRPYLFVMTLKYSGKAFRKVVWKTSAEVWARLHEEAFRALGVAKHVVLDNLREGVLEPSLYEPRLNATYAALLAHYRASADVCRVADPNRKGTVEQAIRHTQDTALKGRRFESLEAQNAWLAHWEERWAAPRIHGRKKRQVLALYAEEQPYLLSLPLESFRMFRTVVRTVDDAGCIVIDNRYYPALPARLYSEVTVRVYAEEVEILASDGTVLRRHPVSARPGYAALTDHDRIFNPSRETGALLMRVAKIGPHARALGERLFATLGRPGHKVLYGLANLPKRHAREDIEAACATLLETDSASYRTLARLLEQKTQAREAARRACAAAQPPLTQSAPEIRAIDDYQRFFDDHAHTGDDRCR
jgi:transposase